MSDAKIEQTVTLSRQEAARWLGELAKALGDGGPLDVALVGPTVSVTVPEQLFCELELEPYGDHIEVEIEFSWPRSAGDLAASLPTSTVEAADPSR